MTTSEYTAFAASGGEAITRTIDVKQDNTANSLSPPDFDKFYEIERTATEIIKGDYKRIALQFPDELLHDSVPIYRKLKSRIGVDRELYVLADTSYGRQALALPVDDMVAAQHVNADVIVHYGYACMTQTSRLFVIYVFGQKEIDIERCVASVVEFLTTHTLETGLGKPDTILIRHDVVYTHKAEDIYTSLKKAIEPSGTTVIYNRISTSSKPATQSQRSQDLPLEPSLPSIHVPQSYSILYIGEECLGLTNLLITHNLVNIYSYSPLHDSTRLESLHTNKLLMRRYATVQKARDADVFGILVGTLGVASYLPLIRYLRTLLARKCKKSYTISVGKLNPSKLANFLEIECFILVACPENSLIDSKEFLRPIVTPFELEIALQAEQSWTGRYVLDFEQLLADHAHFSSKVEKSKEENGEERDPDQPVFSLVTGTYRHAKRYGGDLLSEPENESASAIVVRNRESSMVKLSDSAAGQFLQTRSYQGLETRIGKDAPSILEQGRSGIARGYQDDHR